MISFVFVSQTGRRATERVKEGKRERGREGKRDRERGLPLD